MDLTAGESQQSAQAIDAQGEEEAGPRGRMLRSCLDAGGVHVIDVPIDYEANHRVLGEELRGLTALV